MSASSACALRRRYDAERFRQARDVALDDAVRRLADAALGRALHGVVRPVFYKGERIGEVRRFDERLTRFILRYRDPTRYGAWLDRVESCRPYDGEARSLSKAVNRVEEDAHARTFGDATPVSAPLVTRRHLDPEQAEEEEREKRERIEEAARVKRVESKIERYESGGEGDSGGDVA